MPVPTGPMRVSEMLVHTFRLMRAHPASTLGIGALLATVDATVSGVVVNGVLARSDALRDITTQSGSAATAEILGQLADVTRAALPWLALTFAISFLTQLAATGVMTLAVIRARRDEPVQPSTLWNDVPWLRLLAINGLIIGLIVLAAAGPIAIAVFAPSFAPFAVGFVVAAALVLALGTALAVPASMSEVVPARQAVARSFALIRGAWWRTAGALLVANIIWSGIGSFIATPIASIFGALAGGSSSTFAQTLQSLMTSILAGAIALPGIAIMATLVYFDRIARMSTQ